MELDFTGLARIGHSSPAGGPTEGSTTKQGSPTEGPTGATAWKLQREADRRKEETERNLEVYGAYQRNLRAAGQLQAEILKGAKSGESVYTLFLKAAKAISLMTSDTVFYSQLQDDIRAVYGAGLLETVPLRMELTATQERLQRLKEAEAREPQDRSIQAAIKAHEHSAGELQNLIQKSQRESTTA